jgi:hypothetical protein
MANATTPEMHRVQMENIELKKQYDALQRSINTYGHMDHSELLETIARLQRQVDGLHECSYPTSPRDPVIPANIEEAMTTIKDLRAQLDTSKGETTQANLKAVVAEREHRNEIREKDGEINRLTRQIRMDAAMLRTLREQNEELTRRW